MFAQGFAIKKELINGKPVKEEGIMGEFNKQGARIIEVSDGKAKYTELSPQDIRKLISMRSSPSDLIERLTPLLKHKKHRRHHTRRHHHAKRHHHTRHHHKHGVAHGHHTKKRKTHRRKKRKTHRRKKRKTHRRKKRKTHRRKKRKTHKCTKRCRRHKRK